MADRKKLRGKTDRFCYYYHLLRNGKEAAVKAGFFPVLAESAAGKLLQRADVWDEIRALDEAREKRAIKRDAVAGLQRLAFGSVNDSVSLLFLSEEKLDQVLQTLDFFPISEIKKPKENMLEIKFFDRLKALEKLIDLSEEESKTDGLTQLYQALDKSAAAIRTDQEENE